MKKKAPWRDPIVEEIHRFREEYAKRFDYDMEKMYQDLKRRQDETPGPVIPLVRNSSTATNPPTPPAHLDLPTNLALDDSLIEEAVTVGNHRTSEEAVTAALQEYVQARKRREIFELAGKVDYYDDYDPKRLRDPIVEEVRKHGQEYAAQFDFDPHKMGEDLRRLQKESGEPVVSFNCEEGEEDT
jgi:hypothetical protein